MSEELLNLRFHDQGGLEEQEKDFVGLQYLILPSLFSWSHYGQPLEGIYLIENPPKSRARTFFSLCSAYFSLLLNSDVLNFFLHLYFIIQPQYNSIFMRHKAD